MFAPIVSHNRKKAIPTFSQGKSYYMGYMIEFVE